ncbi:unnamed protein product, partial [Protopolystoma xenopodis]
MIASKGPTIPPSNHELKGKHLIDPSYKLESDDDQLFVWPMHRMTQTINARTLHHPYLHEQQYYEPSSRISPFLSPRFKDPSQRLVSETNHNASVNNNLTPHALSEDQFQATRSIRPSPTRKAFVELELNSKSHNKKLDWPSQSSPIQTKRQYELNSHKKYQEAVASIKNTQNHANYAIARKQCHLPNGEKSYICNTIDKRVNTESIRKAISPESKHLEASLYPCPNSGYVNAPLLHDQDVSPSDSFNCQNNLSASFTSPSPMKILKFDPKSSEYQSNLDYEMPDSFIIGYSAPLSSMRSRSSEMRCRAQDY